MSNIFYKKRKKRLKNKILQNLNDPIFKVGFVLTLSIILIMLSFYLIEKKANPYKMKNLFDSFYYTITTLATVGYGDITPLTNQGKFIAIIAMLFGVILVAGVTGKISSFLVDQQLRRGKGLLKLKKLLNHFIICGWKNDFEKIIEDIIEVNPEFDISDIVLINNSPAEQMEQFMAIPKFKHINYLCGDFIDESVLLRANLKNAKRILILADTSSSYNPIEIDSKTVMAVIAIKKINKEIYTIAELLDEKFEKYLKLSHCDEILLSMQYERALLVNASSGSGVSHVIRDLLKIDNKQKIIIYIVPKQFIGHPFKSVFDHYLNKNNSILIGLLENTGSFFTRKQEALNDAQKSADISKIIENLSKVKDLKANNPVFNPGFDYIIKEHSMAIVIGTANN